MKISMDVDPTNWVVLTLGFVAIVLTSVGMWQTANPRTRWLIIGVVVSGLLLAMGPFVYSGNREDQEPGVSDVPGLGFRVPEGPSVPACNIYQGDGRIPADGRVLVIFDRPVDGSGQGTDEYYMSRQQAQNNDNGPGWHTPLLDIGAERVEIAAVLISNDLFQALLSIRPNAEVGPDEWKFGTLPPGQRLRSLVVQPRLRTETDPSGCPK